jgi:hypothetical protein
MLALDAGAGESSKEDTSYSGRAPKREYGTPSSAE